MLKIIPNLDQKTIDYLQRFSSTKRQQRVAMVVIRLNNMNGIDYCLNGTDTGTEGGYYAYDNTIDESVIDTNIPPYGQPESWCNVSVTNDGKYLYKTQDSQFTKEWIKYIKDNFLTPYGYEVVGDIEGETKEEYIWQEALVTMM